MPLLAKVLPERLIVDPVRVLKRWREIKKRPLGGARLYAPFEALKARPPSWKKVFYCGPNCFISDKVRIYCFKAWFILALL